MSVPTIVVVVGSLREESAAAAAGDGCKVYVLPEPLDLAYLRSKQPDMVVIFDRAAPNSALSYAGFLRARGVAPQALLVAAFPNGHMPGRKQLQASGIALAIQEAEATRDLAELFKRAQAAAKASDSEQMSLVATSQDQGSLALAAAATSETAVNSTSTLEHGTEDTGAKQAGKELETPSNLSAPAPGKTACFKCKRWRPRTTDTFCAWCGEPLISVIFDPKQLNFRTDRQDANGCPLIVRNVGINTLYAQVEVAAKPEVQQRFKLLPERKYGAVEIPGGEADTLTVLFDSAGIDSSSDYSAAIEIHTNLRKQPYTVPISVERPPIGRIVPPAVVKIVYGDPASVPVVVRNTGGGKLEVTMVKLESPGQTMLPVSDSAWPGKEVRINVPLEVEKLKPGNYSARGTVEFSNHSALPFSVDFNFSRPARVRLLPPKLSLELYNIGRRRHCSVKMQNIGLQPVRILEARAKPEWISVLCKNAEIAAQEEGFLDVFVDATALQNDFYQAELEITTNGYEKVTRVPVETTIRELRPLQSPVGIDFGTSFSCAATVVHGQPVLIDLNLENNENSIEGKSLPSVVFFEKNLFPIVGAEAKTRADLDPSSAVHSVKRLLGSRQRLLIHGTELTPAGVATDIFREILSAVESASVTNGPAGSPSKVVFTVPADVSDEQIAEVLQATKTARAKTTEAADTEFLLDEPGAAALYYLYKSTQQLRDGTPELVFIYDFGAGTLDCSLVEISKRGPKTNIRVLATAGNRRLGGDDIDLALAQFIAKKLAETKGFDPHPMLATEAQMNALGMEDQLRYQEYRRIRGLFRSWAEQMKIELTNKESATGTFPVKGDPVSLTVTRKEFEALLGPIIRESDFVIQGCCSLAKINDHSDVSTLLHTGRGSAIPRLREGVSAAFPKATDRSAVIEAKECVALGAAWWAHTKNLPNANVTFERVGQVLPNTICYRDCEGVREIFVPIFRAGEAFPSRRELKLPSHSDRENHLQIYEKRFGSDAQYPRARGTLELPPNPSSDYLECEFQIGVNRILEVTVGGEKLKIEPADDEDVISGEPA